MSASTYPRVSAQHAGSHAETMQWTHSIKLQCCHCVWIQTTYQNLSIKHFKVLHTVSISYLKLPNNTQISLAMLQ